MQSCSVLVERTKDLTRFCTWTVFCCKTNSSFPFRQETFAHKRARTTPELHLNSAVSRASDLRDVLHISEIEGGGSVTPVKL